MVNNMKMLMIAVIGLKEDNNKSDKEVHADVEKILKAMKGEQI